MTQAASNVLVGDFWQVDWPKEVSRFLCAAAQGKRASISATPHLVKARSYKGVYGATCNLNHLFLLSQTSPEASRLIVLFTIERLLI